MPFGELHIGGDGVALGYWNDEDRTNASFHEHWELGRLYRTGDLGRWHRDGYMEFVGRWDNQLKIRGYRIEIGEIEHALSEYDKVKHVVVVPHDTKASKAKYLIAYYVAESAIAEDDLRQFLGQILPEYMIPSLFIHLTRYDQIWCRPGSGEVRRGALGAKLRGVA